MRRGRRADQPGLRGRAGRRGMRITTVLTAAAVAALAACGGTSAAPGASALPSPSAGPVLSSACRPATRGAPGHVPDRRPRRCLRPDSRQPRHVARPGVAGLRDLLQRRAGDRVGRPGAAGLLRRHLQPYECRGHRGRAVGHYPDGNQQDQWGSRRLDMLSWRVVVMTVSLRGLRRAALAGIAVLVTAASVTSFAESYRGLWLWASGHGLTGIWAAGFPLQVDVFVAVGELALFVALADRWPPRRRVAGNRARAGRLGRRERRARHRSLALVPRYRCRAPARGCRRARGRARRAQAGSSRPRRTRRACRGPARRRCRRRKRGTGGAFGVRGGR